MALISDIKELECAETPLFLFDCTLKSGDVHRWSTHAVTFNGQTYDARILQHNAFDMRSSSDDATDGISSLSITLANADAYFSPIERTLGWKGSKLVVTFVFFDIVNGSPASDSRVVFRGVANAPDESNESGIRLTFNNRLNLTRIYLPEVSIQKRCPWLFPADASQRQEALSGAVYGKYSGLYRCGYAPDLPNGCGNPNGSSPFTSCPGTRARC
jgi:phage-related protein